MTAQADTPAKYPDRLVAFMHLLERDGIDVQHYIDRATVINLGEVPVVPELIKGEEIPADYEDADRVHTWAFAVTGSTAKARSAIAQLSDGETKGFVNVGPDQISDVVAEVSNKIAQGVADVESGDKPSKKS